jgi:hypothetical protein
MRIQQTTEPPSRILHGLTGVHGTANAISNRPFERSEQSPQREPSKVQGSKIDSASPVKQVENQIQLYSCRPKTTAFATASGKSSTQSTKEKAERESNILAVHAYMADALAADPRRVPKENHSEKEAPMSITGNAARTCAMGASAESSSSSNDGDEDDDDDDYDDDDDDYDDDFDDEDGEDEEEEDYEDGEEEDDEDEEEEDDEDEEGEDDEDEEEEDYEDEEEEDDEDEEEEDDEDDDDDDDDDEDEEEEDDLCHSKSSLKRLMQKALSFKELEYMNFEWFYRDGNPSYFAKVQKKGWLTTMLKDPNGDPLSPVNERLNVIHFQVNVDFRTGLPCTPSVYGENRTKISAEYIFKKLPRLYFTDFFCREGSNVHHITLVMTRPESEADLFCQQYLIELDPENNDFLRAHPSGQYSVLSNGIWTEVLVTENLSLVDIQSEHCGGNVEYVHWKGNQRTGPKRKDPFCSACRV